MADYQFSQAGADLQYAINIALTKVAAPFSTSTNYAVGDFCSRNGVIYVCKTATSGAWNASRWTEITIGASLSGINTGYYEDMSTNATNVASNSWTKILTTSFPAGLYLIEFYAAFDSNASGYRGIGYGAADSYTSNRTSLLSPPVSGNQTRMTGIRLLSVSATTSMAIWVFQSSGSTLAVYPAIRYIKLR